MIGCTAPCEFALSILSLNPRRLLGGLCLHSHCQPQASPKRNQSGYGNDNTKTWKEYNGHDQWMAYEALIEAGIFVQMSCLTVFENNDLGTLDTDIQTRLARIHHKSPKVALELAEERRG